MEQDSNSEERGDNPSIKRFASNLVAASSQRVQRFSKAIRDANTNHVIAFLTAVIAITTWLQWDVMRQQIDQTDATIKIMREEQRAWVGAHAPQVVQLSANEMPEFSLRLRNTGRTPATAISLGTYTFVAPAGENIESYFDKLIPNEHNTVLAPDSVYTIPIKGGQPMPQKTLDAIGLPDKTHELYLIGAIKYRDTLGDVRQTQFCYLYEEKVLRTCRFHHYMD